MTVHFPRLPGYGSRASETYPLPRTSPFAVVLTSDERKELEIRVGQYTSPYFQVIRAKMILLAAEGLANVEIGSRLGVPRQVVSKWRKRFVEERLAGLVDRPRSGRSKQDRTDNEETHQQAAVH